ncbi:MAG: metal-dependent hydrolase [Magnetococcales bacterium]|nr:metal-dependent hydrolase [Magnetococcales bacterium]
MDPLTHALLGGATAASLQPPERLRVAMLVGGVAAMLPDLDTLIYSASDPLLQLEYHRQFTHALLFTPVGALLAMLALWWWLRRRVSFWQGFWMAAAGYVTGGLLDACTSYGTQLLWPLRETRFAWNIIPVVEPVTTLWLLWTLSRSYRAQSRAWARVALLGMALWFALASWQQQRATTLLHAWAATQGESVQALQLKPTMMNIILWRAVYQSGGEVQSMALRPALFGGQDLVYPGERLLLVDGTAPMPGIPSASVLAADIRRFAALSENYLVWHPRRPHWLGDGRYALLPNSMAPLWGITVDPKQADQHAPFDNFRDWTPQTLPLFVRMLRGQVLDEE